jgi:hypothetical protein
MIESSRISYPMNPLSASGVAKQGKNSSSSLPRRDAQQFAGLDSSAAQKKEVVLRLIEYIKAS